jgi:hypothetical protein
LSADYNIEPENQMSGRELMDLPVQIPDKPGSILLRYRKVA